MKNIVTLLIALFLTSTAAAQFAETTGGKWMSGRYLLLDVTLNDVSYEEPGVMTEDGVIGGVPWRNRLRHYRKYKSSNRRILL